MPCPFTSAAGIGAGLGGAHALLVGDSRYRLLAWATLVALLAGWGYYFGWSRTAPLRIGLEVLSVLALVAGALRVRWLIRARRVAPPFYGTLARLAAPVRPVLASPVVLSLKVWIAAMLVAEWRGKARFEATEYAIVAGALLAAVAARAVRLRKARTRFSALESYASGSTATACPLGFGGEPDAATTTRAARSAERAPRERPALAAPAADGPASARMHAPDDGLESGAPLEVAGAR